MDKPMEIDEIRVDPSPFQLVERTSLHKVGGQHVCVNRSSIVFLRPPCGCCTLKMLLMFGERHVLNCYVYRSITSRAPGIL